MTNELDQQIEDMKSIIARKKSDGENVDALQVTLDALMAEQDTSIEDEDPDDEKEEDDKEEKEKSRKEDQVKSKGTKKNR